MIDWFTLESYIWSVDKGDIKPSTVVVDYRKKVLSNRTNAWIDTNNSSFDVNRQVDDYISDHLDILTSRPLRSAPIWVKDLIMTQWVQTTCGSKILSWYTPPYSATCFTKLEQAGGLLIGKNNLDEFAMWGSGSNSWYGPTTNPIDISKVPWWSSSGSASAVADDQCIASLGTDTGGSVRLPASLCGIVWYKPTYGAISRYGVNAMANSLDQVGILAKSVEDCELIFDHIRWSDPHDLTSFDMDRIDLNPDKKIKIAVFNQFFQDGIDPDVASLIKSKLDILWASDNIQVTYVDFDRLQYVVAIYYIIMPAEVSTNISRFDGMRYGLQNNTSDYPDFHTYITDIRSKWLGTEVKRRLIIWSYVLSSWHQDQYYQKATKMRKLLTAKYDQIFENYDFILWPTSPKVARDIWSTKDDPLSEYLIDTYTIPANLTWSPAISIPVWEIWWLPVGMHIMSQRRHDFALLWFAKKVQDLLSIWR